MSRPLRLVICASHEDRFLLRELVQHLAALQNRKILELWYDDMVPPGADRLAERERAFAEADVIALLVTASLLASDQVPEEALAGALLRHRNEELRIVPIITRPVVWQDAPFGHLEPLPRSREPITSKADHDWAWVEVTEELRRIAESLQPSRSARAAAAATTPDAPEDAQEALVPTRASLRKFVNAILIGDADLSAFCIDYFPQVYSRFSSDMDRVIKINLLLQYADPMELLHRLRYDNPEAAFKSQVLLRYE